MQDQGDRVILATDDDGCDTSWDGDDDTQNGDCGV